MAVIPSAFSSSWMNTSLAGNDFLHTVLKDVLFFRVFFQRSYLGHESIKCILPLWTRIENSWCRPSCTSASSQYHGILFFSSILTSRVESTLLSRHTVFIFSLKIVLHYYFILFFFKVFWLNRTHDIMINFRCCFQHITFFLLLTFQKASDIKNTPQVTGGCFEPHSHGFHLRFTDSRLFFVCFFSPPKPCNIMSVSINKFVACALTMTLTSFKPFG